MSIFATIALVCAFSTVTDQTECGDYVVDHAYTMADANKNTKAIDDEFYANYGDEQWLNDWLAKHGIGLTPNHIESLEFQTQEYKEDMIP